MAMYRPPHPGRGLRDELDHLGLSVAAAAKALGVTRSQLYRVLSGESAISAEMALRLETVIGGTAEHWLRLQAAHDIAALRMRAGEITAGLTQRRPA
jgi:addiction module HigA family antidote